VENGKKKKEREVGCCIRIQIRIQPAAQQGMSQFELSSLHIGVCEIVNIGITMKREASRKSRRFKEPRGVLYYEVAI
jgi:hypothetical protein